MINAWRWLFGPNALRTSNWRWPWCAMHMCGCTPYFDKDGVGVRCIWCDKIVAYVSREEIREHWGICRLPRRLPGPGPGPGPDAKFDESA